MRSHTAQELCESRGGRPGLPVSNSPYGLCGRKATLNSTGSELRMCESRDCRPGLPFSNSPYGLCGRKTTLNSTGSELWSCVKVEVAALGPSVDVQSIVQRVCVLFDRR